MWHNAMGILRVFEKEIAGKIVYQLFSKLGRRNEVGYLLKTESSTQIQRNLNHSSECISHLVSPLA